MTPEPIDFQARDRLVRLTAGPHAGLVWELYRCVDIFNGEFRLALPRYPIINFAELRDAYATYRWRPSEEGAPDFITFSTLHLDREPVEILRTLLHELLHCHQRHHGSPSRFDHHNVEFRAKALECGLYIDDAGITWGHSVVFLAVLAKHHAELQPFVAEVLRHGAGMRQQTAKEWMCGCARPTVVQCASELRAVCRHCACPFTCVS